MHKAKLKALLIGNVWETEDASWWAEMDYQNLKYQLQQWGEVDLKLLAVNQFFSWESIRWCSSVLGNFSSISSESGLYSLMREISAYHMSMVFCFMCVMFEFITLHTK
jgi:hypothetical protein